MVKNYLKIAIRNLLKHKLFSVINVLSITVGLTCSILLYLYVQDELSYDKFNDKKDSIYRLVQDTHMPDGSLQWQGIFHAIPMGESLKEEIPEVENYARFYRPHGEVGHYIKKGEEKSIYNDVLYADFELFEIFDFPVYQGAVDKSGINTVILTERAAAKYFGGENPINKVLSVRINESFVDFNVSAVIKNIPSNSSIQFDVLLPLRYLTEVGELKQWVTNWGYGAIITYVKLRDGSLPERLNPSLAKILDDKYPYYKEVAQERGYKKASDYRNLRFEPLSEVHFNTDVFEGIVPSSDPTYSYVLIVLVIAILGVACFNFMNLSLSRSIHRVKEVGLRKTIGALRGQLIGQFLGESIFISFLALLASLLFADLLLPQFNYLTGKSIDNATLFSLQSMLILVSITLFIGVASGIYPAFVVSRFNIKEILSGAKHKSGGLLSKALITFQFTIATILMIGMLVMNKQTDFLLNKDLGFDSKDVLVLRNAELSNTTIFNHLRKSLESHSGIYSITSANQNFADPSGLGGRGFTYKGESKRVGVINVTDNYLKTMGIGLSQGRQFIEGVNENIVIINEACAKDFELEANTKFSELTRSPDTDPMVVGVMEDFNYSSLKMEIFPMLVKKTNSSSLDYIFIKLSGYNKKDAIAYIEKQWNEVAQEIPFEYNFLSNTMKAQYESDEKWSSIIFYSMGITVLLSCLGLFGMVALGMESKKKEISIRKVLGASVNNIVWLVSNSYLRLVFISYLIAIPLVFQLVDEWLSTFAYKVELGYFVYLLGVILVLIIALGTISIKTVGAAIQNPVNNLRNE